MAGQATNRFHWHLSWAKLVSDIVSPPVVWAVLMIPVAFQYVDNPAAAILWALLYSLFISLIPVAFIAYMVNTGKIGDIHMQERRERFRPFLVTIISSSTVLCLLRLLNAPSALGLLALLSLVQVTVIALITLVWQISMHMMSIAGAAVAVGIIFGSGAAMGIVPLVVIVGAARLNLKRHTPAQVIAGTVLGSLVPVLLITLLPEAILRAV